MPQFKLSRGSILACLTVIAAIFVIQWIYFLGMGPSFYDEGIWLEMVHRVMAGARPYVDFTTSYGPLYLISLGKLVGALGGRLIDMRLVQGIVQGALCFLILLFSVSTYIGILPALALAVLYAFTAANPMYDPTMFWGIRYWLGLFFVALIATELSHLKTYSRIQRTLLFFGFGPLFYYSGEAGVYCGPVYIIWLIFLLKEKNLKVSELISYAFASLAGFAFVAIYLGRVFILYPQYLFLVAPKTFSTFLAFPYPNFTLKTFNYYYPFFVLMSCLIVCSFSKKNRWTLLAASISLVLSLKVSTSRSDQAHLAYCYPFVVFSWSIVFSSLPKKHSFISKSCLIASFVWALICFQTIPDLKLYVHQIASLAVHRSAWSRDPAWGIYEKQEEYEQLSKIRDEIANTVPSGANFYVFPFQYILYSAFGRSADTTENIQICNTRVDSAACASTFNFTHPDYVLWIPEDTKYSWAFDGVFSGFNYPDAFETLKSDFGPPNVLAATNWKLFIRTEKVIPPLPQYVTPNLKEWNECSDIESTCTSLDKEVNILRLPRRSQMRCLRPMPQEVDRMSGSLGVRIPKSEIQFSAPTWFCKNIGTSDCRCSRIREYEASSPLYTKWVWDGFLEPSKKQLEDTALFLLPLKKQ